MLCCCLHTVRAQTAVPGGSTIHVYVNRMQIPVLILDPSRHPARPIPASRFLVNLGGVPPFAPTNVRLEEDDPISLAVLVDRSDADEFLWEGLGKAAGELARSLRPQDTVEVYGIDGCKLRRFGLALPPDTARLQIEFETAAAVKPYSMVRKQQGPCLRPVSLWESMLYVGSVLGRRPGRRILMALTDGQAAGPVEQMDGLHRLLNAESISVFAVRHGEAGVGSFMVQMDQGRSIRDGGRASTGNAPMNLTGDFTWSGYPLGIEAESSGGIVMSASLQSLPRTLAEVIARVRGRYIVEFPRPAGLTAGTRAISVSIGKTRNFIRPAGISVPPASPEDMAQVVAGQDADNQRSDGANAANPLPASPLPVPAVERSSAPSSGPQLPAPVGPASAAPAHSADPLDITNEARPVVSPSR